MSTPDQIAVAHLQGHAMRCLHLEAPFDEAVASLREITERPDLLAQAAGILAGTAQPGGAERPARIAGARLLVVAGADRVLLAEWIATARQRSTRPTGWGSRDWPDDLDQVLADVVDGMA